jgi:hypothetical protein
MKRRRATLITASDAATASKPGQNCEKRGRVRAETTPARAVEASEVATSGPPVANG